MKSVLVVDDEPSIVKLLKYNLQQANFEVVTADNGKSAVELAKQTNFDIILLDLMLPQLTGEEVLKVLRRDGINTPVIVITAKDSEFDRVLGLEIGADDYVTKPFSPREVLARINAVLRRTTETQLVNSNKVASIQRVKVDEQLVTATLDGHELVLTPKEFKLLAYLAKHPKQVLSREQLAKAIWGTDYVGDSRMVDMQIAHLREKMEADPKHPEMLTTVRGFGYRFDTEPK
ncbi:response regulator transcription factor [Lentilactobacillus senioris]|uniref:Winged helix family two component transcriptional regulator n=1 Tax=Lentilactobacillus senioris DSM 24302 = JCM 17472 TaxID=1423802 RepID=A0A0R2CNX2_9LACO|nr:response regulator transcription factor [Lentilactobacillus senioris]KRM93455.1 winged helix family two component transcriptional regulator [Lentilactobacillus senioris DSM 24302 = JCM 17472]